MKGHESKQLRVALDSMLQAADLLTDYVNKNIPAGQSKDKMVALSGILSAILLDAAANIAILERWNARPISPKKKQKHGG